MTPWLPVVAVLIGSSGLAGVVVAMIKVKPEAGQILIKSAESVVVMQRDVMADMRGDLGRLTERVDQLDTELADARKELHEARNELQRVTRERDGLRERVGILEGQLVKLQRARYPRRSGDDVDWDPPQIGTAGGDGDDDDE